MNNPKYYRLMGGDSFVGIKRVVTEYLEAGSEHWQLQPPEVPFESMNLSSPPMGIERLKRPKLGT